MNAHPYLRPLGSDVTPKVTFVELFFDLVYVFSIIQLSHYLLYHLTPRGAAEFAVLFAGIWWAWNYTAWAANWLDPTSRAGKALMLFLMGCALFMAVAVPTAFSSGAGLFVAAYVTMALVRAAFMSWAFRGHTMSRNYAQLLVWSTASGAFWVAGAVIEEQRLLLWFAAVVVDVAAPRFGFWVPGLGGTAMSSWPLRGVHLLERNQLIFIIALGESVLLLGATLIDSPLSPGYLLAGALGFLLIAAAWGIYFDGQADRAEHAFEHAADPAALARASLAYSHGVMVLGAIVGAVGIELIVAHPWDAATLEVAIVAAIGPALFLIGNGIYERALSGRWPPGHVLAVGALAGVAAAVYAAEASGIALGASALAVLIVRWASLAKPPHRAAKGT